MTDDLHLRESTYSAAETDLIAALWTTCYPTHPTTGTELQVMDAAGRTDYAVHRFVAERHGALVAAGKLAHMTEMHHPQRFYLELFTAPPHRRQGIGSALYAHILRFAVETYQAQQIHAFIRDDHPDGLAFARRRGFTWLAVEIETRLDTRGFTRAPWQADFERVQRLGVAILTYPQALARYPDHLARQYALEQMIEADVIKSEESTPIAYETWRKEYDPANPVLLPDGQFTAVLGDQYVGTSTLWGTTGDPGLVYVGITGVLPAWRRMGIATVLKVLAAEYARDHGPQTIITWNNEAAGMLQLNRKLGFLDQPGEHEFVLMLDPEDPDMAV
jgi:mycothiol synthase